MLSSRSSQGYQWAVSYMYHKLLGFYIGILGIVLCGSYMVSASLTYRVCIGLIFATLSTQFCIRHILGQHKIYTAVDAKP